MYIESPKESTEKPLELINEFNKVGGYKVNKHMEEEYISMCQQQLKCKNFKYNIYNSIKKYQVPRTNLTKAVQGLSKVYYKTPPSKNREDLSK